MEQEDINELIAKNPSPEAEIQYQSRESHTSKRLKEVLNLILNENFSGQSTLSPYAKRQADQALKGAE